MKWADLRGRTESWGWAGEGVGWIGQLSIDLLIDLSMLLLMTLSMSLSLPRTRGTASDISMSFWGPTSPGTAVSLLMYLKQILTISQNLTHAAFSK